MESAALPIIPHLPFSQTLKPFPNPNLHRSFQSIRPRFSCGNTTIFSKFDPSMSFARNIFRCSLLPVPSSCGLASVSCSAALSGSSGGGGGGGGGDGGSSGGDTERRSLATGESEDISDLGSDDVIILTVGPQVSSATVDLVWAVPEVTVTENWWKQLGEKLVIHLTTCGFKSNLQVT